MFLSSNRFSFPPAKTKDNINKDKTCFNSIFATSTTTFLLIYHTILLIFFKKEREIM